MQQALYPGASVTEAACGPVSSRRRANKFMLAGAAVVTAGALVSGPAAQSLPVEIQNRAVQLTGLSAKVTDSPFAVYSEIVTDTLTNVGALGGAWLAHPFPILTQVATNQIGYASEFFGAVLAAPANWQAYSDGRGATFAQQFATAIAAGDIGGAVQYGSSYLLYGALATISPIYNTLLSSTPRGSTVKDLGIPEMIFQNLANVVGAIFSPATFVSGLFTSVYGAAIGTLAAVGDCVVGFVSSLSTGNVVGAINSLVNLPGVVVNALVNGWQHPTAQAPFPALLTYENGGTRATTSVGLLGQLLVTIPASIVKAITPVVATPTTTVATLSVAAAETASVATEAAKVEAPETATSDTVQVPSAEPVADVVAETASVVTESADDATEVATVAEPAEAETVSSTQAAVDDAETTEAAADEASAGDPTGTDSTDATGTEGSSAASSDSDSDSGSSGPGSSDSGSSDSGSSGSGSGSSDSGSSGSE